MLGPTSDEQIRFLVNLQRLLAEGQFVATYKYALLLSLADIAVEKGQDDLAPLEISTRQIAEKFICYYWRQSAPYTPPLGSSEGRLRVLKQNVGKQAGIVSLVEKAKGRYEDSLPKSQQDHRRWKELVSAVNTIVKTMPLWKLQTVGRENFDFLYENKGHGNCITLKPGIASCLRKFHPLVTDLVRGAWVRYVRRFNPELMGTSSDLHEFLFGSERANLSVVVPVLKEVQSGDCFYCHRSLSSSVSHVDHFIPWSRYPIDLGHNFVLAHASCNSSKSDRLAASEHLERWAETIADRGSLLTSQFNEHGIFNDLHTSLRITEWAYRQTFEAGGLTWVNGNQLVALDPSWHSILSRFSNS